MVQLTLPKGSKPVTGKVHKAPPGAKNVSRTSLRGSRPLFTVSR